MGIFIFSAYLLANFFLGRTYMHLPGAFKLYYVYGKSAADNDHANIDDGQEIIKKAKIFDCL